LKLTTGVHPPFLRSATARGVRAKCVIVYPRINMPKRSNGG